MHVVLASSRACMGCLMLLSQCRQGDHCSLQIKTCKGQDSSGWEVANCAVRTSCEGLLCIEWQLHI